MAEEINVADIDVLRKSLTRANATGNAIRKRQFGYTEDTDELVARKLDGSYLFYPDSAAIQRAMNELDTGIQGQLADLQLAQEALQGSLIYIGNIALSTTLVTQSALNARAQELGRYPLQHGFVLVDSNANDWWYDSGAGEWRNIGGSVVTQATNTTLGIVKGSTASLMGSINGAGEISINGLADALNGKAASSHTHDYLPLAGGNLTGNVTFNNASSHLRFANSGTGTRNLLYATMGDSDMFRIAVGATASNAGYAEIATADDGNEPIYVRQYTGDFSSLTRTLTLLDSSGYTRLPSYIHLWDGQTKASETPGSSSHLIYKNAGTDNYLRNYAPGNNKILATDANGAITAIDNATGLQYYVKKAGDTMTGNLTITGPNNALHIASVHQKDSLTIGNAAAPSLTAAQVGFSLCHASTERVYYTNYGILHNSPLGYAYRIGSTQTVEMVANLARLQTGRYISLMKGDDSYGRGIVIDTDRPSEEGATGSHIAILARSSGNANSNRDQMIAFCNGSGGGVSGGIALRYYNNGWRTHTIQGNGGVGAGNFGEAYKY
jgi:hypothetical protein